MGNAKKMNVLDWITVILVIIGALNWGFIGFFNFDLVVAIFGQMDPIPRIIYCLIGLAGVWIIFACIRCCCKCKSASGPQQ